MLVVQNEQLIACKVQSNNKRGDIIFIPGPDALKERREARAHPCYQVQNSEQGRAGKEETRKCVTLIDRDMAK